MSLAEGGETRTGLDGQETNVYCWEEPGRAEDMGDNIRHRAMPAGKEESMTKCELFHDNFQNFKKRALLGDHEAAKLTHLSLFSGIGGLDLAAEMAGFRTVGQCEWADYPTKVLEKHWPDVPRWRDIRTLTGESFHEKTGLRTVDIISGGFPCQPFSVAGKRRGKEDDRYLWPEMLRVIQELRPSWVIGENVAGIVNMALDQVYADLENEGYSVQAVIIPACAVDAPHRRDRCAIIAYNNEIRRDLWRSSREGVYGDAPCNETDSGGEDVAYSDSNRLEKPGMQGLSEKQGVPVADSGRREAQPGLGGVDDGLSAWMDRGMSAPGYWMPEPDGVPRITQKREHRSDRLKCLGNAVVPQQFYPIFQAIADIERGIIHG